MKSHEQKIQALTDKIGNLIGLPRAVLVNDKGEKEFEYPFSAITPTDILRALESIYTVDRQLHIDWCCEWIPKGHIRITLPKGHPMLNIVADIDLSKPLHEQSETTVSELYKLFFE
jgi:hypothetical protein